MRRMRTGELLAGLSAIGLLAVMFADWFGAASAWESLTVGRLALALTALLGLTLVVLTMTSRSVAMASSAAAITVGFGSLTLLYALYRVGIDEPGRNAAVAVHSPALIGLALVLGIVAGAWRSMADERTGAGASLRQTERVLAVRGAPRPAPPRRDPSRTRRPS
jgi:uncharacterized membrane protein